MSRALVHEAQAARVPSNVVPPLTLDLPMPPSVNNLFVNITRGRTKSSRYRAWITEAGWMLVQQRNLKGRHKLMKGEIAVTVRALRQHRRKRDLDNILKPILDLLVSTGTIKDDSLVASITAEWVHSGTPCTVIISQMEASL